MVHSRLRVTIEISFVTMFRYNPAAYLYYVLHVLYVCDSFLIYIFTPLAMD